MRKSIVALGLLGSVVLVGGVLARPGLFEKTAPITDAQRVAPPAVGPNAARPLAAHAVEAPAGFRRSDAESGELRAEAPFKLTASDGTGLVLASLDARAVIEGPLAFTELRLVFENPENRVLEGRFQTTLPIGASVSRFAMRIGNEWQEGEVVEKKRARLAYEDFLHRKQDPALLEQAAGNEFTARVFPIPPRGRKEIILSYSNEIAGDYTLPLRGLSAGSIDVRATSGSKGLLLGERHGRAAGGKAEEDFVVHADADRATGLRSGNLLIARVRPEVDTAPDPLGDALILLDTSASRGLGFEEQIALVTRLVGAIAASYASARISVACFDQSVEPVYEGEAAGFGADAIAKIRSRGALGASNLAGAIGWARGEAQAKKYKRLLLVSDGVATAGATDAAGLKAAVLDLGRAGIERVDAIAEGGIRDDASLNAMVKSGLARDGVVVPSTESLATLGKKLASRTESGIVVHVDGATWTYPSRLDGVQAGDEILVYAEVPEGQNPSASLTHVQKGKSVDQRLALELTPAERPLVERAWAKAKIAALSAQLADAKEPDAVRGIEREIIATSTKNRVLSPYTALLVLETEEDFRRFDIDRKALSGILTVEDGRLATVARTWDPRAKQKTTREDPSLATSQPGPSGPGQPMATATAASPAKAPGQMADVSAKEDISGGAQLAATAPPPAPAMAMAPRPRAAASEGSFALRTLGTLDAAERRGGESADKPRGAAPYTGTFKTVMDAIAAGRKSAAFDAASKWHAKDPGDVMALVALGEAFEAQGDVTEAARAYGSLIDLFSSRADLRRFAGERLERLKSDASVGLAVDTYEKAANDRPDHPASHRLLAWAHVRNKAFDKAFGVLEKALGREYPQFEAADRILREDLGIIAKAWLAQQPERAGEVKERLSKVHASLDSGASLRFVLNWETDANDVDFHIFDSHGGHAFYQQKELASGGELYADITTGYGPECFTIRKARGERDAQYTLQAHYYSRGPMGYGMGKLQIIDHDGKGGVRIEDRPFVVMADQAFVNLGVVQR